MIASGEKKEEYREIKDYWVKRFVTVDIDLDFIDIVPLRHFDVVTFRNGYSKNAPTISFKCDGISTGSAKPEWSESWMGKVFIIKLGQVQ